MKNTNNATNIRFHYVRDRRSKYIRTLQDGRTSRGIPLACIASQVDRVGKCINIAMATVHSSDDTFSYYIARKIALGRLEIEPIEIQVNGNIPYSGREIAKIIMEYISYSVETPSRVKNAARKWLSHTKEYDNMFKYHGVMTDTSEYDGLSDRMAMLPQAMGERRVPRF